MGRFNRAPEITRARIYGVSAEGEITRDDDRDTFALAVDNYGFMVAPGEILTGSQWMQRIARTYDASVPRNAAVLAAISRTMRCEEFADDHLVIGASGAAVFRGMEATSREFMRMQCNAGGESPYELKPVAQSTPAEVACAEIAMARRDAEMLGATLVDREPGEKGGAHFYSGQVLLHKVVPGAPGDLMSRMLRLLDHSPVGAETFSGEENDDFEAQCELASRLMCYVGYEAIVIHAPPQPLRPHGLAPREPRSTMGAGEFGSFLGGMAEYWSEHGWTLDDPVFLCRPGVLKGVLSMPRPFESIVHSEVVGFRLPKAMVAQALERHRESHAERMR